MKRTIRSLLVTAGLAGLSVFGTPGNADANAVGGPGSQVTVVRAHSTDVYQVRFYAGEPARIIVSGDGDTDLDLYVYDSLGNLVASDTDLTDDCVVSWIPRWTGTFRVEIRNRGDVFNRYVILTN